MLSRDLNCQYKTAFVLAHKLRKAIGGGRDRAPMTGHVEIDGAHFGGYVKPANLKENRRDRRLSENQSGKREVFVAIRERGGRTITVVTKSEGESVAHVVANVCPTATVHADEHSAYDALHARFEMRRINHSEAYAFDGACTNMAESFFSRLRRAEIGIHHSVAGPYLAAYAGEMAWRENNRRRSNGEQFAMIVNAAAEHPVSRQWKGYWERRA